MGAELAMMNEMMRATIDQGTGRNARLKKWQAAGKTGTSQNSRDGWFIGYTANLTTGIWFGNDDGSPTSKITGGGLPAKTWKSYMDFAHNNIPPVSLPHQGASIALFAPKIPTPKMVVPRIRPAGSVTKSNSNPDKKTNQKSARKTNQRITGAIRPAADLGHSPNKPKSLVDLLFN